MATRLTSDSVRMRYLIRSAIVIISRPCCLANFASSGTRAIVPSSFMISQITPAGYRPAMRARSTAASVCPARTSTPPGRARSGNMCPGAQVARPRGRIDRRQHRGRAVGGGDAGARAFAWPRSARRTRFRTASVFSLTISGISSSSSRSGVIDRQIRPRPYRAMKLIASGVTFSAAIVRSPSFSRSSSSTTMIIRPARMASTASSIRANGEVAFPAASASFGFAGLLLALDAEPVVFFFNASFPLDRR